MVIISFNLIIPVCQTSLPTYLLTCITSQELHRYSKVQNNNKENKQTNKKKNNA